ncbi:hypothetical protein D593_0384 [Streptococcus intermedius BA1]|nr:hypothetical protein D593_0384 [Streptococcus intermedius BA1]
MILGLRCWKKVMVQGREVASKDEKSALVADILADLSE